MEIQESFVASKARTLLVRARSARLVAGMVLYSSVASPAVLLAGVVDFACGRPAGPRIIATVGHQDGSRSLSTIVSVDVRSHLAQSKV